MNYYNEFDPNAAAWLRELIESQEIPPGVVDERSIKDVGADDLRGFTQCHFFAGIGGWSLALQLAGWPEDRPVWTGSCPCQPYSTAGKNLGTKDERDLWPVFGRLIAQCHPEFVFGEQVENAIRHGWLDRVYSDLESEGYTVGATVLGAHSVGAPHRRLRLYYGACRRVVHCYEELRERIGNGRQGGRFELADRCGAGELAQNTDGRGCGRRSDGDYSGDDRKIQAPGLRTAGGISESDECERDMCIGRIVDEKNTKRETAELTGYCNRNGMGNSESNDKRGNTMSGSSHGERGSIQKSNGDFRLDDLQGVGRGVCGAQNIRETSGEIDAPSDASGIYCRLPESEGERRGETRGSISGYPERIAGSGDRCGVADNDEPGREGCDGEQQPCERLSGTVCVASVSPWSDYRLIYCRDEKVRRVPAESLLFSVADGFSKSVDGSGITGISEDGGFPLTSQKKGRGMLLKGYGNAIVPQIAAVFIMAFNDTWKQYLEN